MDADLRYTLFLFRQVIYLGLLVCAWQTLSFLSLVVAPVAVALVLAFLLDPSVRALEARKVPRWLAVLLMVLTFVGALIGVILIMPHLVRQEIERFAAQLPTYERLINTKVMPLVSKLLKGHSANLSDWVGMNADKLVESLRGVAGQLSDAVGSALLGVAGFFRILLAVLLVPIFTVSFLMDMPHLMATVRHEVPPRHQRVASDIVHDIYIALGGWLRGQLTVMVIQAALYSIGLSLFNIPLAVLIGCTAGFLAFVPYVGVSIGLLAALLVALLEVGTRGATPLLGVLATFGTVQLLDALVITPRAVGGRIGLSAVGVIFALSLGGQLLGYSGLLLAVPAAAVLKALWPRLEHAYVETTFYRGKTSKATPSPDGTMPKETGQIAAIATDLGAAPPATAATPAPPAAAPTLADKEPT